MLKKIIIAVLVVAILAASVFGVIAYRFHNSLKPAITAENLAENATLNDAAHGLKGTAPFSAWKAQAGEAAEIDFGKEVTFNTVTLNESGDNVRIFRIYKLVNGEWELFYEQDRIAGYRMCTFEPTTTTKLKIEVVECDAPVKLSGLGVYNQAKSTNQIKVSQYLTMGENEIVALRDSGDEGFSGYYDVVTDVIIIGSVHMDEEANIFFPDGEQAFADNLQALRDIIGDRNVRIWSTVRFDQPETENSSSLDVTRDFINNRVADMTKSIADFVGKYDLYGIDYDWEYPLTSAQWKAYDKIVTESAAQFKVSVALPPWGVHFSRDAVKCIEHVNVMAYDLFDSRGDHANIQWGTVASTKNLLSAGFEKSQILLGIPTYGRTVDGSAYAWPVVKGNEEVLGKFNSIVKDNTFTDDDGETHTYDAYVQSYAEARDKTAYAEETELGGVMIFRAKCDAPYTNEYSIHRGIKEAIDN
ncbi:MAG: glycoside hydrolase family 18 protein [Candidatus Fimenecus sp.]